MKAIYALGAAIATAASAMISVAAAAPSSSSFGGWRPTGPRSRPAQNEVGYKLRNQQGTIGLGMHRVNKHPPINGVTVSPKKDIGKGPAATAPVRGYSTNRQRLKFEKAARRDFKAIKNGGR